MATRVASFNVIQTVAAVAPTFIGGAADLAESVRTTIKGAPDYTREAAGRNVNWGVREHAMGGAVNGLALHGGIVRPFGASFLIFTDYMRTPIRLSSLMQIPSTWVYSHDSVGLGEDGPTHQPIEQLASLRAIPGLTVIRPADANETAQAWRVIVDELEGPALLVLSRQDLPTLDPALTAGLARGAYVLAEAGEPPDVVLIGTGSEVSVALEARETLAAEEIAARVVSMPSWELFAAQEADYRDAVLPPGVPRVSVEAATTFGWERYADRSVGIDRFGASAPGAEVLRRLGITPAAVAEAARALLDD
jgi:transketolase